MRWVLFTIEFEWWNVRGHDIEGIGVHVPWWYSMQRWPSWVRIIMFDSESSVTWEQGVGKRT